MARWCFTFDLRRDECDQLLGCVVCGQDQCEHSVMVCHRGLGIRRLMGLHARCAGYGTTLE